MSSTAMMPLLPPASMAMLQMVMRSSMPSALDRVAGELHRLVERTVDADHADDVQDDVLAAHPRARARRSTSNLMRRGHLEPRLAGRHARGRVGGADAGRERAERAVRAGVRVGADDDVAGADHALLGQQRVLDAHAADLVVVRDALLARELAHHLGLLGGLDVLVGRVVVGHERDLGRGPRRCPTPILRELLDGDRRGDVVGEHEVELAVDELPGLDLVEAGVRGEDLLGDGHGSGHGSHLRRLLASAGWSRLLRRRRSRSRFSAARAAG